MNRKVIIFSVVGLLLGCLGFLYWRKRKTLSGGGKGSIYNMNYRQFYKLMELVESSVDMFDLDDWQYYSEEIGKPVEYLFDIYAAYGRSNFSTSAKNKKITELLKRHYCKVKDRTWEHICQIAEMKSYE